MPLQFYVSSDTKQEPPPFLVSPVALPSSLFVGTPAPIGSVWSGDAVMGRCAEGRGGIQ